MRINLIPMAGEGQRFKDAGYTIPKPLIDIDGLPMVVRAAKALPAADRYIFICRKEHLAQFPIQKTLEEHFKDPLMIVVDELTQGQAVTCLFAKPHIPADAILTIGASDNDMVYDTALVDELFKDDSIDGWAWTFRNNPAVLQNPKMYGWVVTEEKSNTAVSVSCKKPISENPMADHAVIGAFTFKRAQSFFDGVEAMIQANDTINNEFYVDVAINYVIRAGNCIKAVEVEQYICWGTPKDYVEYMYWLRYFKKRQFA